MAESNGGLNLVLLGKIGVGKSASGNTILGREAFIAKKSSTSVTRDLVVKYGTVDGFPVTVYDTPGVFNTTLSEEETQQILEKVIQECESHPCVFLLVIKADRFTEKERKTVQEIEELLGENHLDNTWILFTGGDELEEENMTIKEFINGTERLKSLVEKYGHRYHVFNNKITGQKQAQELLIKIYATYPEAIEIAATTQKHTLPERLKPTPVSSRLSRRIVLLGKSGVGKSAAGNTILRQNEFRSMRRMNSVTNECLEKHGNIAGRKVSVVDTPGFFHTHMKPEELAIEIARSVYLSSPGPHAFLIVLRVNDRFTEHELQIPQMIEMMFGEEVLKYSIILFTHGDMKEGESVEKLIKNNSKLRHLVDQCGGRFHVFNNRDENNRKQVNDLLKKIDSLMRRNGGGHYSNQMFQNAHRFGRKEEERRRREEKQRQEEIERVRKETEERIREEYEGPPRFLQRRLKQLKKREEEIKKQEDIERVIKEIEERIREKIEGPLRFKTRRQILMRWKVEREKQRQEEIERVIKETEQRIRAEFKGPPRIISRHILMRLGEEREKQQQEEKQRQEEFERVINESWERIRAGLEGPPRILSRCILMRLGEERERLRKKEKLRQEEIERVRKDTEERIRVELETERSELDSFKVEIQREQEKRKQQEEKPKQEVIERVIIETIEAISAEKGRLPGFISTYKEEERRKREKEERKQDIERVRKETEKEIREEFETERSEIERVIVEIQRDNEMRKQRERKLNESVSDSDMLGQVWEPILHPS